MISTDTIREKLNQPIIDKLPHYIATLDSYKNQIDEQYRQGKIKMGLSFGYPVIDEHLRWKTHQMLLVVGHTNVGKSTVIWWLMVQLARKHNLKFCIYSAENRIHSIAHILMRFYLECEVMGLDNDRYHDAMRWVDDHFKFIEHKQLYSYSEILGMAQQMGSAWGVNGFLLDPYNSLRLDLKRMGTHEYHYQAAEEIRLFSETTGISMIMNCHTLSEAQRKVDHKTGHIPPPLAADVEGGVKFVNKADDSIVIHRQIYDKELFRISELHVRKVRETDTGGYPTRWKDPILLRMRMDKCGFNIVDDFNDIREQRIMRDQVAQKAQEQLFKERTPSIEPKKNDLPF